MSKFVVFASDGSFFAGREHHEKPNRGGSMDKQDKRRFIEDLCANIQEAAIDAIPRMPEEWDGIEIRQYLADKFADSSLLNRKDRKDLIRRRRDYRNEVIVRNL